MFIFAIEFVRYGEVLNLFFVKADNGEVKCLEEVECEPLAIPHTFSFEMLMSSQNRLSASPQGGS